MTFWLPESSFFAERFAAASVIGCIRPRAKRSSSRGSRASTAMSRVRRSGTAGRKCARRRPMHGPSMPTRRPGRSISPRRSSSAASRFGWPYPIFSAVVRGCRSRPVHKSRPAVVRHPPRTHQVVAHRRAEGRSEDVPGQFTGTLHSILQYDAGQTPRTGGVQKLNVADSEYFRGV